LRLIREVHGLQQVRAMELHANDTAHDTYFRRLMHRWLVEYNPLYLLSATLVLGGMILTSRGLAREGSLYGEIGVAAIAELYAATLIGGAALLTRIGQRRPAVMLALLTMLYQCDLTLQTEASPYLGAVGTAATVAWLALFVAKLYALAWAMKLRVSKAAYATAVFAALGLAVLPRYLHDPAPQSATALVAVWLFGAFTLHGIARTGVSSAVALDAWGETVLRRAVRASWALGGMLFVGHVLFWSTQHPIVLVALVPIAPLLAVRSVRVEAQAWFLVAATLLCVAVAMPGALAMTALIAAAALVVRALLPGVRAPSHASATAAVAHREVAGPYRAIGAFDPEAQAARVAAVAAERVRGFEPPAFVMVEREERMRLLTGALFAVYLGVWTLGWTGGDWPAHVLALDLASAAVVLLFAWRARARVALVPLTGVAMHAVVQAHLVPAPRSLLEWGASAVGLGFALLLASLAASYRLRKPT
jgi:uncharacterized protein YhhL (DUF1145 family)